VPREPHRDGHVGGRGLAAIALIAAGEALEQEERAGFAVVDPPVDRCTDARDDVSRLDDLTRMLSEAECFHRCWLLSEA
jgi:hypothetical protein